MARASATGKESQAGNVAVGDLAGLGEESVQLLLRAGIADRDRLQELGAVGAWVEVHRRGLNPTLNLLYVLEGILRDMPWTRLPYHVRASLTLEADAMLAADRTDGS